MLRWCYPPGRCTGAVHLSRLYDRTEEFPDGYRRSRRPLKGHLANTVVLLGGYYAGLILLLHVIYIFCILVAAVGMSLFTDNRLALAILPAVGDRIELVLIFLASMGLALGILQRLASSITNTATG